jgi:hypothetical protein
MKTELWGLDYENTNVAYRADNGGYKPLTASGYGWGESSI